MSALPEPITDAQWQRMGLRQRTAYLAELDRARAELHAALEAERHLRRLEGERIRHRLARTGVGKAVREAAARLLAELPVDPQAAEHRAALVEW